MPEFLPYSSLSHGLRPMTNGLMPSSAPNTEVTFAPLQLSPQPTRPSSVVAFTMMSVTPSRFTRELTSRCV